MLNAKLDRIGHENLEKLSKIDNPKLLSFISRYIELCNPKTIFISTDSPKDRQYLRDVAVSCKEEVCLKGPGHHTIHFDGYFDQARDKRVTKFLIPKGAEIRPETNVMDMDQALKEAHTILKDIMKGHEMFIRFNCLGPRRSEFMIPCVHLTDSAYIAHSEALLYRSGYDEFVRLGRKAKFFKFVHSIGEREPAGLGMRVCKNRGKRRVLIDLKDEIVFSMNTQYGGNTLALKKLAMRLAINRAMKEGWLTEHMFIMGVHGPKERISYFSGAFPSMCGKTSTAMVVGESIVGDDIAYLKKKNGIIRAVNVEKGIFGIIDGINSKDDPIQWKALHSDTEIIFSNCLVTKKGRVYWNGKDDKVPDSGVNQSGEWFKGKKGPDGKLIPPSHKNARFSLDMDILDNVDPVLHEPEGVSISGIIYGGRDSNINVPVEQAFDWEHGIITKAAILESETTAATLGKEGVRKFNPMANLDFLSVPLCVYIQKNLDFGNTLDDPPPIFSVNYFLREKNGSYLNSKKDKKIWLKWMELRVHDEVGAIRTPTGYIPLYEDLRILFKHHLDREYTKKAYMKQFTIRVHENLSKMARIVRIYKSRFPKTPSILFRVLKEQRTRLLKAKERFGDNIPPDALVEDTPTSILNEEPRVQSTSK